MSDELTGNTLPSQSAKTAGDQGSPGDELPFETPGRYAEEQSELGRGGLGRVVLTRDLHLGREVAVKELLPELIRGGGSDANALTDRFLREARITAKLEHPGVVPVHEIGKRNDGALYYVMKRVQGKTLEDALRVAHSLEERLSLLPHFLHVVQTMGYAHARGVVHRDLKPANVMVGAFGETQVVDWGLARERGDASDLVRRGFLVPSSQSASQTVAGAAMGTPTHMSPEQARGEVDKMDEKSDVWSLGVILFELLTGHQPFGGTTVSEVLAKVQSAQFLPVKKYEPNAPTPLAQICERALKAQREERFAHAGEMADALEHAMGVHAEVKRRPLGWMVAVAALAVAVLVLLGLWWAATGDADAGAQKQQRLVAGDAVERARLLAEHAQSAWDDGDVAQAEQLAREALALEADPLARGVRVLTRLSGRPEKVWEAKAEAGCSALSAFEETLACSTFGGVQLFGKNGQPLRTLSTGATGFQTGVVFLDSRTVVSGGDDKVLHLFDLEGKERAKWEGHKAPVRALASFGGLKVVSGAFDGEVRVWDRESGQSELVQQRSGPVKAVALRESWVASSARDGVQVVDLSQKAPREAVLQLDRLAQALGISTARGAKGPEQMLWAGVGRSLLQLSGGLPLSTLDAHLDDVTAVLEDRFLGVVTASADGTLRAWRDGRETQRLSGFSAGVQAVAMDQHGPLLYLATRDRQVEAWRWPIDARQPTPFEAGVEPTAFAFGDGETVVGDRSGKVRLLVATRNALAPSELSHQAPVTQVAWLGTGTFLSGGEDGRVIRHGALGKVLDEGEGRVLALAVSPTREHAAWSRHDGALVLWSLAHGAEVKREAGTRVWSLAFSPDGRKLAVGREDKALVLLDAATGDEVKTVEGFDGALHALAFSPDGRQIAAGGVDRKIRLVTVATGLKGDGVAGPAQRVGVLTWSSDGTTLWAGSDEGSLFGWDFKSKVLRTEIRLRAGDVNALAATADRKLLVGGSDGAVRTLALDE